MFEGFFEDLQAKIRTFQVPPELRQNFEAFLSKLGASTRKTVAVSFSPNIGIEMIEVDNLSNVVTRYASRPLAYDSANRRMESYTDFANALTELFEEFEISANSNVILSLPNISFGLMEIPPILHGDTVRNVLLSEIEQSYMFRSNEPLVTWHNLSRGKKDKNKPNKVLYSAIQKEVIDEILAACQNVGCRFLTIETSHLSALRGLSFLGMITDQVKENAIWQLMIIEANVFSIITLQGNIPIAYFEEPLALKSFEEDEIYKSIAASALEIVNNEKTKSTNLLIVSQTDLVSAEVLRNEMETQMPVDILECNKYSNQVLYPTSYQVSPDAAEQITLNAIGAAAFLFYNYPIYLNYIKETVEERENIDDQIGNIKVNLGNIELNITRDTIRRLAVILGGILLVPLFLVYLILGQFVLPKELDKSNALSANIDAVNKQIESLTQQGQQTSFDINTAAKQNVQINKSILFKYSTLGEIVPKNLWITHSEERDNDFLITGVAVSTHTIYDFYKNLKATMTATKHDVHLTKLEFTNENIDNYVSLIGSIPKTLYGFEISTSKEFQKGDIVRQMFNIQTPENVFEPEEDLTEDIGSVTTSVSAPPRTQLQAERSKAKAKQLGRQAASQIQGSIANPNVNINVKPTADAPANQNVKTGKNLAEPNALPPYLKEIKE